MPENRQAESSRNIELHYYRFPASQPSGRAPVFVLPGGPGGYFDDDAAEFLQSELDDPDSAAAVFRAQRDVVLVNQRGARKPDRRYQYFGFLIPPAPLDEPFSAEDYRAALQKAAQASIENWKGQGVDVSGYDIMNMVEDVDDLREGLGYERVLLRGTSFGSQWSFAYMQAYPERVDRAVLGGTEPIDYGYDSPQSIWHVFERLEQRLNEAKQHDPDLGYSQLPLTDAIKQIVQRLAEEPVQVEVQPPRSSSPKQVTLGVEDFQRHLRSGIGARRETPGSLENFPKFIFEILDGDYRFLAAKVAAGRVGFNGASLQALSIDNSLGISAARDQQLDQEPARAWVGELNLAYKATRAATPSPVVPDTFRTLTSDTPILLVHGDLDLSTPIENAEAALETLSNAHLIRVPGGTHGAFDQLSRDSEAFRKILREFLAADFQEDQRVESLGLPAEMPLEPLQFAPQGDPSLYEQQSEGR
ncbi:MAG: alpha/beta hydrolase [Planctomycetota bacterium]